MRATVSVCLAALAGLISLPADAIPVPWTLEGTIDNSRTLGNFGSPAVGSPITVNMVVETDTPDIASDPTSAGYFNVFDAFTLSIGTSVLTLGPDSPDPGFAREANALLTVTQPDSLLFQFFAVLYEGDSVFSAEFFFAFDDPGAFPNGMLGLEPPSLATATRREFNIYSPVAGDPRNGAIFLASGSLDSFAAVSVPEPSTLALVLAGFVVLAGKRAQSRSRDAA
jgi:hypothetical protein